MLSLLTLLSLRLKTKQLWPGKKVAIIRTTMKVSHMRNTAIAIPLAMMVARKVVSKTKKLKTTKERRNMMLIQMILQSKW